MSNLFCLLNCNNMKHFFYLSFCIIALSLVSCGSKNSETTTTSVVASSYSQQDNSSTKWKDYAGNSYRASELVNNIWQNYAFNFNTSGRGKYIVFGTLPNSNVVTDQMEFEVYKVTSDANNIYLHCSELSSTIKIKIRGNSLYTANRAERYEKW